MITAEDLAQAILELKKSQEKTDEQINETAKQMKETDEQIKKRAKELDERMKKTDEQMKKRAEELDERMKKTDEQMKKTDEELNKLLKSHKALGKMVGGISNNQGDIAEEFFYNSLKFKPTFGGIDYDFIDKNVTRIKNRIEDEYDILLVNGKDVAIIETKYKAHSSDIEKLVTEKYENFKKLYPEYKNYKHHLGLASFYINEDVKDEAIKNNVILVQRKGDLIETIVSEN